MRINSNKKRKISAKIKLESLMVARHTPGVHKKVKRSTVGIAGVGGIGSHVAVALARTGIGKLVIADFDVVEPSNLNRQAFNVEQIGEVKVKALKTNIKKINPYVKIETHQVRLTEKNVPGIFKDADILVEALDVPKEKTMLASSFSRKYPRKPIVMVSGLAGFGPGDQIKTRKIGKYVYVVGDMKTAAGVRHGVMAPRVGIAAHQQANLVLRLILGKNK